MITLILGILGMVCILLSFIFNEFDVKKFDETTKINQLINIVGAGLLLYYALSLKGWPFFILNAIWVGVAVIKLGKIITKNNRKNNKKQLKNN